MPDLSAVENLFVGIIPRGRLRFSVDWRGDGTQCRRVLRPGRPRDVDPREPASALSIAQQQLLECARALAHRCNVIFFDEPTSPLTAREANVLFDLMRRLRAQRFTLGFISHRLDEVLAISDRITVLRDANVVAEFDPGKATSREMLVAAMVGHDIDTRQRRRRDVSAAAPRPGGPGADVRREPSATSTSRFGVARCSASRGLLAAAARRSPSRSLACVRRPEVWSSGTVVRASQSGVLDPRGTDLPARGSGAQRRVRRRRPSATSPPGSSRRFRELVRCCARAAESELAGRRRSAPGSSRPRSRSPIKLVSGGNQQRAMFSRWLLAEPRVAIFDEPDAWRRRGAKDDIYEIIDAISDSGIAS